MNIQQDVIVVSGLPRSGTSLLMQMLASGGLEPMTDEIRQADTDNPRGYFEFELVKKIKEDHSWLPQARGKVVKMISQLLYHLPPSETYKIIFMRRDMSEIIASQEKMLARRGNSIPPADKIAAAFETHLAKLFAWLSQQANMQIFELSYNELMATPEPKCSEVIEFLGLPLDQSNLLAAIDPALYRNSN